MTEALKRALLSYANRHADPDGLATTPIAGFAIFRAFAPVGPTRSIYRPLMSLVLQGSKRFMAGEQVLPFGAGQSLIVHADVPVTGWVTEASAAAPYLAVALDIEMALVREIMQELPVPAGVASPSAARAFVDDIDEALLDCAARLLRLLDRPEAIPVLRGGIVREMHYWLLSGRHGAALRKLAAPDGRADRIARAVGRLRTDYARAIRVEDLAAISGMSLSSFHQHFKAATSVTPLQFQKQLRLLEARRLLLGGGANVSRAAIEVGYESVSQFTREYARMFGAPPRRDVARLATAA